MSCRVEHAIGECGPNAERALGEGFELGVRHDFAPILKFLPEIARGWEIFGGYNKNTKGEAPNLAGVVTKPLAPRKVPVALLPLRWSWLSTRWTASSATNTT